MKSRRIRLFVCENDLERERCSELVGSVANAAELEFEISVLLLATALEDDMGPFCVLVLLDEQLVERFKAKAQGEMIGVILLGKARPEPMLVDNATDQDEIAVLDDIAETAHKGELLRLIGEFELSSLLADLALVQDYDIVAEIVELELLERGNNLFAVVLFVENAEGQNEQRVIGVDIQHAVIAALINVDHEIAEAALRCSRALSRLDNRIEVEFEERELLFLVLRHYP